ncbi:uncharacterized protein [Spinacia oleracea]|uniref:Retrotransposon gag domain-containing protein n=1 Tax=Spinacia oleracea TaxID=3562 RepID=A0A9R0JBS4_SPIOL|nr:uncharacterized protein LOC110802421 [Spinacia oleracea]
MRTPFCEDIMNAPKEPKVKTPTIEAYDGTTDPDMHLVVYRHHMYVQGANEATWCKYFPATLKGVASKWFERLPPGSIASFDELQTLFSTSASKDGKTGEATDSSGKKEKIDRKVPRINGTWALSKEHDTNSPGQKRGRPQERKYFDYNTDLFTILVDVGTRFDLKRPFPMKSPAESRDPKLYFQFHEDIGHDTKDCRSLKRALDDLASKGHLKNYLKRSIHGTGKNYYKKNKSPVLDTEGNHSEGGFVAVISGGPASGGPTVRGQKDYACRLGQVTLSGKSPVDPFPRIEICESDGGRVATPHDDPLVVEIKISNMRVKRILIDTGSSSDIMSMECLSRLAHDPKTIETTHYVPYHWLWRKHHTSNRRH